MNNFGLYELASTRTTSAPGWAYVPDTGPQSAAAIQPTNRKRARNTNAPSANVGDLSARQEARKQKEAEKLDKDGNRDNTIPIPSRPGKGIVLAITRWGKVQEETNGPLTERKHTANVRKILQSQKTFANHLDDYTALQALTESNLSTSNGNQSRRAAGTAGNSTTANTAANTSHEIQDIDNHPMLQGPIIPPPSLDPPPSLPGNTDPMLMTALPPMPSEEEMKRLLAHPPLTYLEARGQWEEGNVEGGYPVRRFCEVCGYWGRVRCMKCGTRVCALECLGQHQDQCERRFV